MTSTGKHEIKMIRFNKETRRWETVYPKDNPTLNEVVPLWLADDDRYYSCPDYSKEDAWQEWQAQYTES